MHVLQTASTRIDSPYELENRQGSVTLMYGLEGCYRSFGDLLASGSAFDYWVDYTWDYYK